MKLRWGGFGRGMVVDVSKNEVIVSIVGMMVVLWKVGCGVVVCMNYW